MDDMKRKIWFFNLDLRIGGVERQLCYLLNGLDKRKYEISLVLCKKEGDFLSEISSDIEVMSLSVGYSPRKKLFIAIKLFFLLLNKKPDVFVSFHGKLNSISILICYLLKVKIVCCFPGYFYKGKLNFFRNVYLKFADKLIAVSNGVRNSLKQASNYEIDKKILVIENAVDYENIITLASEQISEKKFLDESPIIVSMGRLDKGKGFDVLIRAIPLIKTKCNIMIIGNGKERINLVNLCKKTKVADRVFFVGMQTNPYKYLHKGTLFVLASESEGLPTVILEAKALGIPCICADYLGGTQGVVDHGVNGYVFKRNDERELAYAIDLLLRDIELRKIFIQESAKKIQSEFSVDNYVRQYEKLFDES